MNARFFVGITGLLATVIFSGCDTTQSQMTSDYNSTYQRIINQKHQAEELSDSQSDNPSPGIDVAKIATMNISLLQSNALLVSENAQLKTNYSICFNRLQINDTINENKDELIQKFQNEYSTNKEAILEAAGGNGQILDFQVQDVIFHKGYVVVIMEFLCSNEDNSGCLGKVGLSLDPDKDYDIADCSMLGKTLISAQELTLLTSQSGSPQDQQAQAQQIEQSKSPEIQAPAQSPGEFHMSDTTKNTLIQTGAEILGAIIIGHELNSDNNN